MESLKDRIVSATAWSFVSAVSSQGLTLLTAIVSARYLGTVGYGELGMIQSSITTLAAFAGIGLGMTATKFVAEHRLTDTKRAGSIIALTSRLSLAAGSMLALGLVAFARPICSRFLNAPHLVHEFQFAACLLPLGAVHGVQTGTLAGFEAFRWIAKLNLLRSAAMVVSTLVGVIYWGLPGAVLALVVSASIACAAGSAAVRSECKAGGVTMSVARKDLDLLWRFSVPAVLSATVVVPVTWITNALLANQPNGYAQLGIFTAANQWRLAVAFLPMVIAQPLLAMVSRAAGEKQFSQVRKLIAMGLLINSFIGFVAAAAISLHATRIVGLFGSQFTAGGPALTLLAFSAALSSVAAVLGQAIAGLGQMWAGFYLNMSWAAMLLLSAVPLAGTYGATGLAAAYLLAYAVHTVATIVFTARRMHVARPASCGVVRPQPSQGLRVSDQTTVLLLTDYYWPGYKAGGTVRTVKHLVDRLAAFLKFRIVTRDRDLGDREPYADVPFGRWHASKGAEVFYIKENKLNVRQFSTLLRNTNYDLLYLNGIFSPYFTLLPLFLRKFFIVKSKPVIIAMHGECAPSALAQKRLQKWIFLKMQSVIGLYDGVTFVASNDIESRQIKRVFGRTSRVVTLPNIAVSPRNGDLAPRSPKLSGALRILFLSRIVPVKNLRMCLGVVRHLKGQVTFDIYGPTEDEKYWRECRRAIEAMPENVSVTYKGVAPPESVPEIMNMSDVLLLPTLGENFGHVIVEALGSGMPAIISDRTPWRKLGAAGADLSLEDFSGFVRTLQAYVDMGPGEYSTHRAAALAFARRTALDDASLKSQAEQLQGLARRCEDMRPEASILESPSGLGALEVPVCGEKQG
ncbi:MAG: oligosaccharide flippase family protein [Acidobacteria bacterium]|nr:oligosaccharide flippase family protein [Acidobacteriota bacterium]